MEDKLRRGVQIWVRNREAKDEYQQEILKNMKEGDVLIRIGNMSALNCETQLNEVLAELGVPCF